MRLAFNIITTGKLALFVLSALIKGISSGRMASFSLFLIVVSGMSKKKSLPIPPPTSRRLVFWTKLLGLSPLLFGGSFRTWAVTWVRLSWTSGIRGTPSRFCNRRTACGENLPIFNCADITQAGNPTLACMPRGRLEAGGEGPPDTEKNWRRPSIPSLLEKKLEAPTDTLSPGEKNWRSPPIPSLLEPGTRTNSRLTPGSSQLPLKKPVILDAIGTLNK